MASGERRKCKGCHKLFRPDPRNRYHQRYCAAQSCRAASKAASQARWLAAPENQDLYEAPRVKRLFRDQHFFLSVSRELAQAQFCIDGHGGLPCLAALSGQPPEPGGSRRKARGVDGESACRATMMPGPITPQI